MFWFAIANFAVFWLVSMKLGGDALSGKAEDGRYYLMAKGKQTEVSRGVYVYSMIHTVSVIAGFPLAFAGVFLSIKSGGSAPGESNNS